MSAFTDLLQNINARRLYLVTVKPYAFIRGTVTASATGNKFTGTGVFRGILAGDVLQTKGPDSNNNGTVTVTSATDDEIVVTGLTLTNQTSHTRTFEGTVVRYYSTDGFVTTPTDTPASTWYDPRVEIALQFTRSMYEGSRIGGQSIPGFGQITINNLDGGMDAYRSWGWSGRRITVEMGGEGFARNEYGVIFDGLTAGIELSDEFFTIEVRDLQALLDQDIWVPTYLGTGATEGPVDLLGQYKPLTIGKVRNIEPIALGIVSGRFTYQFHDGSVDAYDSNFHKVYDQGVPLIYTASNPGPIGATPSNPSSAQFSLDTTNGLLIVGGAEPTVFTADTFGTSESSADTIPRIMEYLVKERLRLDSANSTSSVTIGTGSKSFAISDTFPTAVNGKLLISLRDDPDNFWMFGTVTGWSGGVATVNVTRTAGAGTYSDWVVTKIGLLDSEIVTNTFSDLNALNPSVAGIYLPEGGNALEILDELAQSIGAYYGFNREGKFEVGRLESPTGTADLVLSGEEVLELSRDNTRAPTWRIQLGYNRNWRPMDGSDLAGSVRANVVTNGTFDTSTGWTFGTGWSFGTNRADAIAGSASDLSRSINLVAGQTYTMRVEVTRSAGTVQPKIDSTNLGSAINASGVYEVDFTATATTGTLIFSKDSTFAGAIDNITIVAKRLKFLSNEYRVVTESDTSIRSVYGPNSISERINTLLDVESEAQTECSRQLTLFSTFRDVFRIEAKTQAFSVDINSLVELTDYRWGLDNGKLFRVLEISEDTSDNRVSLTLWG